MTMQETLLHQIGNYLRSSLQAFPLDAARYLFLLLIAAVLILILRLPTSETTPVKTGPLRWDENLKIWATLALLIQLVIYWLF
jgi:hypothetical protein